ncbi:hypothetical protein HispidOSU_000990, partial [Sigmodon hispidus]
WCSPVVCASRVIPCPDSAAGAVLESLGRAVPSTIRALAFLRLLRLQLEERARVAGRERCLRRHLREREPGRAN